jgi:hypothetical protein
MTTVGMAVAAETEIETVVDQALATPIEGDTTVEIESTTVDESQIVVDLEAPLTEADRDPAVEVATGSTMRLATAPMRWRCAATPLLCPRDSPHLCWP